MSPSGIVPSVPAPRIPLYLAAPSRELDRVTAAVAKLEQSGLFRLVDPWWQTAAKWCGRDAELERTQQIRIAEMHQYHMRHARIFWMLWPERFSHGALYELGYASSHRWCVGAGSLQIIVSGRGSSNTVYTAPAQYREESDTLGFHAVLWAVSELRAGRPGGG